MQEELLPISEGERADPAEAYRPWKRSRTYVVFGLGTTAGGMLMFSFLPSAIVTGWIALGFGIPAVVLAHRETTAFPKAASHGFIRWGRRLGWWGIVGGVVSALAWVALVVALGIGTSI